MQSSAAGESSPRVKTTSAHQVAYKPSTFGAVREMANSMMGWERHLEMTSGLCGRSRKAWKRTIFCNMAVEMNLQRGEVSDLAANDCGRRYLSSGRVPRPSGVMCRMLCPLLNAI